MQLEPELVPPQHTVHIYISIPRERRAELHFHLEASDGMGYLEEADDPDQGVIHTPPELLQTVRCYLASLQSELAVSILKIESAEADDSTKNTRSRSLLDNVDKEKV